MMDKRGKGRPLGIPREGKYGMGCKTRVVRVPEAIADNIAEILASFDAIRVLADDWDDRIEVSAENSITGKPSPRYDRAVQLLMELRRYLD
jgi:hypothetical protein